MKFFCVAVALFVALVAITAAGEDTPVSHVKRIGTNANSREIRSTLNACRKDFRALCLKRGTRNDGAVTPVSRTSPNECLQERISEIQSDICKTWVKAEQSCTTALRSNEKCSKNSDIRRCIGKVPAAELPEDCTSTEFYKSFVAMRRRGGFRQNRTKTE